MIELNDTPASLTEALNKRGYTTLTPVQRAVLAPELGEADLLVSAQTGSGKTVAFGLALASTLLGDAETFKKTKTPLALVIAPTRELALQVQRELAWLYEISGASVIACVGGMDAREERRLLERGAHIVVGTPGRLGDHIKRGAFDTSGLKAIVLDEADEMLDMGFREELEFILDTAPASRRTLMFSATVPKSIAAMAKRYQNDARRISTKEETKQHLDIDYQALIVAPSDRDNAIINLLRFHEAKNAIIFCGTRAGVNNLKSRLMSHGFSVVALSGELSQAERSHALQSLRDGKARVCVATDVASRGIDLPGLALVIHADLPKDRDALLHRSGRTGRAGAKGVSALIVPHHGRSRAERLFQTANIEAHWQKPPSMKDIKKRDHERFLANPALSEPIKEEEQPFVQELLAKYGPEQIAAALIRMHNTQNPAPEELIDASSSSFAGKQKERETFTKGIWIELSIGQDDNADPRWLIPVICGGGHIIKRQIGSIRIHAKKTHVELAADCVDKFFEVIGPSGKLEKNIVATRFGGIPPEAERRREKGSYGKNRFDKGDGFKKKRDDRAGDTPNRGDSYRSEPRKAGSFKAGPFKEGDKKPYNPNKSKTFGPRKENTFKKKHKDRT
jgi:ATP-dependent RNA helicase DeaD